MSVGAIRALARAAISLACIWHSSLDRFLAPDVGPGLAGRIVPNAVLDRTPLPRPENWSRQAQPHNGTF
jgi:hypothetical protein